MAASAVSEVARAQPNRSAYPDPPTRKRSSCDMFDVQREMRPPCPHSPQRRPGRRAAEAGRPTVPEQHPAGTRSASRRSGTSQSLAARGNGRGRDGKAGVAGTVAEHLPAWRNMANWVEAEKALGPASPSRPELLRADVDPADRAVDRATQVDAVLGHPDRGGVLLALGNQAGTGGADPDLDRRCALGAGLKGRRPVSRHPAPNYAEFGTDLGSLMSKCPRRATGLLGAQRHLRDRSHRTDQQLCHDKALKTVIREDRWRVDTRGRRRR